MHSSQRCRWRARSTLRACQSPRRPRPGPGGAARYIEGPATELSATALAPAVDTTSGEECTVANAVAGERGNPGERAGSPDAHDLDWAGAAEVRPMVEDPVPELAEIAITPAVDTTGREECTVAALWFSYVGPACERGDP